MNEPWIEFQGLRKPLSKVGDIQHKAAKFCVEWLNGKTSFEITTSGSTGPPKKITIKRESMIASSGATAKALDLQEGMTSLVCLDTGFIAGMMMLVRSMTTGMNMIITEPSANPLQELPSSKIDFAALVPYQMNAMLQSDQSEQLSLIGTIILGGASINVQLLEEVSKIPAACYATFGMTETISHIALQRLNGIQRQENFHALDGVRISQDDRGCLVIEVGYLGEKIITNDIVDIVRSGEFKWLGRWDSAINSGGVKVFPEKIEKVIGEWMFGKGLPNRFFAIGQKDERLGEQVVLVIEGKLELIHEKELLTTMRTALAKYEIPKKVLYVTNFKETPTGKIDRSASLRPDAMDF